MTKSNTMKRLNLLYSIMFFLALFAFESANAQEQPSRRQRADHYYERMEFAKAADAYERLVDVKRPKITDMERLAYSYLYIKEYDLAENWYARVVDNKEASAEAHLNYADVLKQQGKYARAKEEYQKYMEKYGESEAIQRAIRGADSAQVWMRNPTVHKLRNEAEVNTSLSEFGLISTSNGAIYAGEPNSLLSDKSGMTGQAYLRVYTAQRHNDNSLSYPNILPGTFNDAAFHVGPVAANVAEDVLYVTRTNPEKSATERFREGGSKWQRYNLELMVYRRTADGWEEETFAHNNAAAYSLGHAALSADEQVLYYASDMPGGHGGVDIWYSELQQDGSWGAPQNAGPEINTNGDEMFPCIHGETLYFSSTGHIGMGGLDIFRAEGSKSDFSTPQNLGYPVNSAADDFSFFVSSNIEGNLSGYLSSNRQGGVGADDIYSFNYERPRITIILEGMTRNKDNGELLSGSDVTLFGENDAIVAKVLSGKNGDFRFDIEANTPYRIYGEKQGFFPDSLALTGINARRDTTIRITLNLQPVFTVGDKFVLENIYYDFDKHNIRPDAALILDKLVATMRDNPTLRIELSSHTDSRGTHKYNERLSQRRAQSAVNYIVSRGIARDRLVAKGYGETRLVNHCADGVSCTPAQHQANRRTEVEVLAF